MAEVKETKKALSAEAKEAKERSNRIPTKEFTMIKDNGSQKKGDKVLLNKQVEKIYRDKELIK